MTKQQWYVKVKFTEYLDFGDEAYIDDSENFDTLKEATDYYNKKYDELFNFKGNVHCQIPKKEIVIEKPVKISVPLSEMEKLKKTLEIIKEKRVDIEYLKKCQTLEEYDEYVIDTWGCDSESELLTQEEFDLLLEVI